MLLASRKEKREKSSSCPRSVLRACASNHSHQTRKMSEYYLDVRAPTLHSSKSGANQDDTTIGEVTIACVNSRRRMQCEIFKLEMAGRKEVQLADVTHTVPPVRTLRNSGPREESAGLFRVCLPPVSAAHKRRSMIHESTSAAGCGKMIGDGCDDLHPPVTASSEPATSIGRQKITSDPFRSSSKIEFAAALGAVRGIITGRHHHAINRQIQLDCGSTTMTRDIRPASSVLPQQPITPAVSRHLRRRNEALLQAAADCPFGLTAALALLLPGNARLRGPTGIKGGALEPWVTRRRQEAEAHGNLHITWAEKIWPESDSFRQTCSRGPTPHRAKARFGNPEPMQPRE